MDKVQLNDSQNIHFKSNNHFSVKGRDQFLSLWKRGFLEIIAEILQGLKNNPPNKTHLNAQCNLDSRAITKYLDIMKSLKLVKQSEKDPSFYTITQKGIDFSNHYEQLIEIIETVLKKLDIN